MHVVDIIYANALLYTRIYSHKLTKPTLILFLIYYFSLNEPCLVPISIIKMLVVKPVVQIILC